VRRVLPPLLQKRLHRILRRPLIQATSARGVAAPIEPALEERLRAEFAPGVMRLAELIGRPDLPALWGYGHDEPASAA
nr:hypothetical protein [Chloroflexota bacterium]